MVKSARHVGLAPHKSVFNKVRNANQKRSPKYMFILLKLTKKVDQNNLN